MRNDAATDSSTKGKAPFGYFGGKSRLAQQIIPLIPKHHCYVEPYCGAAWILLKKPPSEVEVLNDLSGELVNFWRMVQTHPEEILRCLEYSVASRRVFEDEKDGDVRGLTEIQRAVRFYYVQKLGFGGRTDNRSFSVSTVSPPRMNHSRIKGDIRKLHRRLGRVYFENLPALEILKRYDRATTFFYLDPPYWGKRGYEHLMEPADYLELRDTLRKLKGRFILSLNDCSEVREMFSEFRIRSASAVYSVSQGRTKSRATTRAKEVLVHNLGEP